MEPAQLWLEEVKRVFSALHLVIPVSSVRLFWSFSTKSSIIYGVIFLKGQYITNEASSPL